MRGIMWVLVVAVAAAVGCSKNEAASAQCGASADATSCQACCTSNGANGYKYTGANTCSCLGGKSSGSTPATGAAASFAGPYKSNWGSTVFAQDGSRVTANYPSGSMSCNATGNVLDCDWHDGALAGKARLTKDASGAISGTWGNGASNTNGGSWNFSP